MDFFYSIFGNSIYSDYNDIGKKKIGIPNTKSYYDLKVPPAPNSKGVI